jgi:uncharacterized protein (DUF2236 family)
MRGAHRIVRGTAPDGRPYSANDPHLLAWVHHALVDSFLRSYQRFGAARLLPADADRYVAEQAVLARRMRATSPRPAESVAELREWLQAIRPELEATREARDATRHLVLFRSSLPMAGPYALIAASAVGLLPGFVRRALWLPSLPIADRVVVRPAAAVLTRGIDWILRPDEEAATA